MKRLLILSAIVIFTVSCSRDTSEFDALIFAKIHLAALKASEKWGEDIDRYEEITEHVWKIYDRERQNLSNGNLIRQLTADIEDILDSRMAIFERLSNVLYRDLTIDKEIARHFASEYRNFGRARYWQYELVDETSDSKTIKFIRDDLKQYGVKISSYSNGSIYYQLMIFDNENYNEIIRHAQKAIDLDPNDVNAYLNMGDAYVNLQDHREAIRCFQKAIDLDPNNADAYYSMGVAYTEQATFGNAFLKSQNKQKAIQYYQKAIDLDPNHIDAYLNMGTIYTELHDYKEAMRYFQKVIDVDPDHPYGYSNIGLCHNHLQNYQEAIQYLQKAIDVSPDLAAAYHNMGLVYDNLQNYQEAIQYYQKAIDLDPNDIDTYLNMGNDYYELGNEQQQIKYYQQAARLGHKGTQEWLRENKYSW